MYLERKKMDYAKQEQEFAPLVGKAILNFGLIEFSTLHAAEILPHESIVRSAAKLQFKARVELLIEILNGRRRKGEAVLKLIKILKQTLSLAEIRNIIAHNSFLIEISYHKGVCNHTQKICSYLNREKKLQSKS